MPPVDPHLALVLFNDTPDDRQMANHVESLFFRDLWPKGPTITVRTYFRFEEAAASTERALPRVLLVSLRYQGKLAERFAREVPAWGTTVTRYPDKPAPFERTPTVYLVEPELARKWTGCLGPYDRRFLFPIKTNPVREALVDIFRRSVTRSPVGHHN